MLNPLIIIVRNKKTSFISLVTEIASDVPDDVKTKALESCYLYL